MIPMWKLCILIEFETSEGNVCQRKNVERRIRNKRNTKYRNSPSRDARYFSSGGATMTVLRTRSVRQRDHSRTER